MDGCTASRELRKRDHRAHIVAMTANAFAEDRDDCLASGMCDYASKPVGWERLRTVLRNSYEIAGHRMECKCARNEYK